METPQVQDAARRRKNRLQLIAIVAIVLVPVLGSTLMYYTGIGMPTATNNRGLLVEPPITINDMVLRDHDGQYWSWNNSGNFRLILLSAGACDEVCAELLHNMRQVHVRLSKRASSLERWFVQLDDNLNATSFASAEQPIAATYPGLAVVHGDLSQWRERLRENPSLNTEFQGHQILLIDRRGNLVMAFNQDHAGQEMLDDVEFLIKSTQ